MPDSVRNAAGTKFRWPKWATGRFASTVLPGLAVTFLFLLLHALQPAAIAQAGNLIFDAYQRAVPRAYEEAPVRVVDIDDETLAKLGQWPWPRTDVARLVRLISDAGASAIAFDIVFSEPDRTSPARMAEILRKNPDAKDNYDAIAALTDHDAILGKALAETPSVTGLFLTREANAARPAPKAGFAVSGTSPLAAVPEFQGAILPLAVINAGARGNGFVSIAGNQDGIVRTVPLIARIGEQTVPSLSLEALRVAQGAGAVVLRSTDGSGEFGGGEPGMVALKVGDFEVPTMRSGAMWMYYTAPHPDRIVPAWKILTGELTEGNLRELFEGRLVFVGAGAAGLRDLVATPLSETELGVVVHAQMAEQMILGRFLTKPDWAMGLERAILLILGIGIAFSLPGLGALWGGMLSIAAFAAAIAGSWSAFRYGALLIDPTYPAVGVIAVYIAGTSTSFYKEERARAYIRRAFDRYLSPELVERIARDPSQLELGGEERDMTVMFCDIRGFSAIAERLTAPQIITFLIEFLTPMTDVLLARKATIDKYIGDAILAFWNAPLNDPDHPRNAALAALAMVERLKIMNTENIGAAGKHWPREVKIGIGLNTGPCCVGNIGSQQRLNYSLIGDTVNVASRIEGLTKVYGVPIIIGREMAVRLTDFATVELDLVRVVGRDMPEEIYALLGPPELAQNSDFQDLRGRHTAMLVAYHDSDWDGADAALAELLPLASHFGFGKIVSLYAERIAAYRKTPPPHNWDGVHQATEK